MEAYNANRTGKQELQQAQTYQAGAQAGKAQAQSQLLQEMAIQEQLQREQEMQAMAQSNQGLGGDNAQASAIAKGLLTGEVSSDKLNELVQTNRLHPEVANMAMYIAQNAQGKGV
jgi:hypothetical protein